MSKRPDLHERYLNSQREYLIVAVVGTLVLTVVAICALAGI